MTSRRDVIKGAIGGAIGVGGLSSLPTPTALAGDTAADCIAASGFGGFKNLKKAGVVVPKRSDAIEDSPWGIQTGAVTREILEKAAELGVKRTRINVHWESAEKEPGRFDWSRYDEAIDATLAFSITPFVTVTGGNRAYTGVGRYDDPKLDAIYGASAAPPVGTGAETDAWLNFVEAAVRRYGDRIQQWEIWNEPNHRNYWGAPPNGKDYGDLVRVTTEKIHTVAPEATIIAGSIAGIDADFTDAFLGRCDPERISVISFHHYSHMPEDRAYFIADLNRVLEKHGGDFEIWQGECGYPSQSRTTGYRGRGPWGHNIQAKWLLRQSFVDTFFCGARLSNYFLLSHHGSLTPEPGRVLAPGLEQKFGYPERGGSRVHADGVNQKCLLFRETQTPKPAYYAYQNLCSVFDRTHAPYESDFDYAINDHGVFYGIGPYEDAFPSLPLVATFRTADGLSFIAYWLPWYPQETLAAHASLSLEIADARLEDPVLIDLLAGTAHAIGDFQQKDGRAMFPNLPLGDYPLAVTSRKHVTLSASG